MEGCFLLLKMNSSESIPKSMEKLDFEIVPFGRTLDRLWHAGAAMLRFFPENAPNCMSNHYHALEAPELATTGAEHTLATLQDFDLSGFGYQDGDEL